MSSGFALSQAALTGTRLRYSYRFDVATSMLVETLQDTRELPTGSTSPFLHGARSAIIHRVRELRSSWAWRLPFASKISNKAVSVLREVEYLQNILLAMENGYEADALCRAPFVLPHSSRRHVDGTYLPHVTPLWLVCFGADQPPTITDYYVSDFRTTGYRFLDYEIVPKGPRWEEGSRGLGRLLIPSDAIRDDGSIRLPGQIGRAELFWKQLPAKARFTQALAETATEQSI